MNNILAQLQESFSVNWQYFAAQTINATILIGLFILATKSILARGRGWEVPVWIVLSFIIPIVFPIIALIHFRQSKKTS